MENTNQTYAAARKTFWTVAAFYFLIGFEFIYMATPFAMYFYSVYRPGLGFIGNSPVLAWLGTFFLPHLVIDTKSVFLNMRVEVGITLTVLGFTGFCVGAIQVYYHKLAKKGAVTGGVYNFIRHPQYASLILCSFGLMVMWPRYLVLLSFIAMLFVYYFLARLEEKECENKFGPSYLEYKRRTGMFFPFRVIENQSVRILPPSGVKRAAAIAALYVTVSIMALIGAHLLKVWSVEKIFARYEDNAAWVSVTRMSDSSLKDIMQLVDSDSAVQSEMYKHDDYWNAKFVNYILPAGYYALEIPMLPEKTEAYHFIRRQFTDSSFKIVFTKVAGSDDRGGKEILLNAVRKVPAFEVWVDARLKKVTNVVSLSDRPELIARMPGPMF